MTRPGTARLRSLAPRGAALAVCLLAGGCASSPYRSVSGAEARAAGWTRVEDVAELRQRSEDGCGAAALAMVLGRWGHRVTEEEIRAAAPSSPGEGLRADALRDFARSRGLRAFVVEGTPADLAREVARDRPVLVGTVKRRGGKSFRHYEVVVGLHERKRRILTLDPARGARESPLDRFEAEWAEAGRLTLVVLPGAAAAR